MKSHLSLGLGPGFLDSDPGRFSLFFGEGRRLLALYDNFTARWGLGLAFGTVRMVGFTYWGGLVGIALCFCGLGFVTAGSGHLQLN